jgi:hypothetical protein
VAGAQRSAWRAAAALQLLFVRTNHVCSLLPASQLQLSSGRSRAPPLQLQATRHRHPLVAWLLQCSWPPARRSALSPARYSGEQRANASCSSTPSPCARLLGGCGGQNFYVGCWGGFFPHRIPVYPTGDGYGENSPRRRGRGRGTGNV